MKRKLKKQLDSLVENMYLETNGEAVVSNTYNNAENNVALLIKKNQYEITPEQNQDNEKV
jgi:hypothetical protein